MPTILLVDDEPPLLTIFRAALERAGYVVLEAENGEGALHILHGHVVDAVVTDVVMPRMGGRELMWRMSTCFPAVPVILISGILGADHVDDDVRPADYLSKPIPLDELVRAVQAVLKEPGSPAAAPPRRRWT